MPPPRIRQVPLRQIVNELARYGQHYISRQHKPLRRLAEDTPLPASLGWGALRGEGIIRLRFCHCFESLGFTWTESEKLLDLWEKIGCHRGLVFDLLAQAGIFAALSSQCHIAQPTPELAWSLYCGLADSLEREDQAALLTRLTDDLWLHHYRRMFPDAPASEKSPSLITLRQRALKALQKHYKLPVELKESFTTDSGLAGFSLRYRLVYGHTKTPFSCHAPETAQTDGLRSAAGCAQAGANRRA